VLADADFRTFVAGEIAPMVQDVAPGAVTSDELQDRVAAVLADRSIQDQLETFVVDVHKGLLGRTDQPAVLSQATVTQIVSAALPGLPPADVADLHPVTINPPRISALTTLRTLLLDKFGLLAGVAAILLLGSMIVSRNRRHTVHLIGRWLIGLSLAHLLVLWIIPVFVIPAVSSSPWVALIAAVARALSGGLVTGLIALLVIGVGVLLADRFVVRRPLQSGGS
jgi:hypothetical protein